MSATLSPPVRVVGLLGILAAAGLAAFLLFLRPGSGETTGLTPRAAEAQAAAASPASSAAPQAGRPTRPARTHAAPARQTARTRSGFPPVIDRALRRHRVVVVAVTMPGGAVDRLVRAEARAGAAEARAGFVAVSARSERLVRGVVAKTGVLPQPAIVVLARPGRVAATLGVVDRETVAAVAAQAR